ncbi:ubiquitin D-like isoform X2 [Notamacropus eugenii]
MKFSALKDDKIQKIKEQIMSEIKVPIENQKLFLGSETLNPEKKLSDYSIDPSTTIHLILKVVKPSDEEQMVPQMEVDKGKKDPVHVKPSGSVSQVKEVKVHSQRQEPMEITAQKDDGVKKIHEEMRSKTKVPIENQVSLLGSKGRKSEKKLFNNCLEPSSSVHLNQKVVYPSDEEVQMFLIEADKGKKHTLHVKPSTSVSEFMDLIQARTTMPPQVENVSYNGKVLEIGKSMIDYLIPNLNTFFSAKKCIGG